MDREEVLAKYDQKEIEEVIAVFSSLGYSNCYEDGKYMLVEVIHEEIKTDIKNNFISFWGEEYADRIKKKVDDVKLNLVFQTLGETNSIEAVLFAEKQRAIYKKTGRYDIKKLSDLADLEQADFILRHCKGEDGNYYWKYMLENGATNYYLERVLKCLKINPADVLTYDMEQGNALGELIVNTLEEWRNIPYTENQYFNEKLNFLENFVNKVKRNNQEEDELKRWQKDPILLTMNIYPSVVYSLCGKGSITNGQHLKDTKEIFLQWGVSEQIVIHEFVHAVEDSGYQRLEDNLLDPSDLCSYFCSHKMLDEVITDYFATMILNKKYGKKAERLTNEDSSSLYASLFSVLNRFIDEYLVELKETRMMEKPVKQFTRFVPEKLFEELVNLTKEWFEFNESILNLKRAEQEENQADNWSDVTEQVNIDNGKNSLDEIAKKMQQTGVRLGKMSKKILRRQPPLKVLGNILFAEERKWLERFHDSQGDRHALDMMGKFYRMRKSVDEINRNRIMRKLNQPLPGSKQMVTEPEMTR